VSGRGWHADDTPLRRYLAGDPDLGLAASVEAHLIACAACRERIAALGPDPVLERAWGRAVAEIATPPPSPMVRLLRRLGVPEADAVLLRAARSLDGSWTLATVAVVAFAALAAMSSGPTGRALYLLIAPLVPVIGVVVAFASSDPLGDLATATPYSKARLALLRTAAVAITSIPIVIVFGAAVPPIGWLAFAWLAPAIALTVLTLAVMTWWSPVVAGAAAGGLWLAVVAAASAAGGVTAAVEPPLIVAYAALALLAAACLAIRLTTAHVPGGHR
jgi:hypothetical protein